MALKDYVSSAWQDISNLQTPVINGARQQAQSAHAYISSAWEEVWGFVDMSYLVKGSAPNTKLIADEFLLAAGESNVIYAHNGYYTTTPGQLKMQVSPDTDKEIYFQMRITNPSGGSVLGIDVSKFNTMEINYACYKNGTEYYDYTAKMSYGKSTGVPMTQSLYTDTTGRTMTMHIKEQGIDRLDYIYFTLACSGGIYPIRFEIYNIQFHE